MSIRTEKQLAELIDLVSQVKAKVDVLWVEKEIRDAQKSRTQKARAAKLEKADAQSE